MELWFVLWLLWIAVGIVFFLPLYGWLFKALREHHPEELAAMGNPSLFMASPGRSLRLQGFIYRGSRRPHIAPEVARLCRLLAVTTPIFVVGVFAWLLWGFWRWGLAGFHVAG